MLPVFGQRGVAGRGCGQIGVVSGRGLSVPYTL